MNPSERTKKFIANNKESNSGFIQKKIAKYLKKSQEQKVKSLPISTYKSVFGKFTVLFLLWLISIFFIFIYYKNPDNRDTLLQTVIKMADKFNCRQVAIYLRTTFIQQPDNTQYFMLLFFIVLFTIIGLLWFISFLCWPALLKVINYFFAIGCGCTLGSCYIILNSPIFWIFLFVIPLSVTCLVLGLITYLHQIKQKFKIADQVKQKFITLSTLFFFFGIFIQVFLFLVKFDKLSLSTPILILIILVFLLFYILEFVFAAFIWAIALNELDQYVAQKLPKKYEFLLVSLMFMSFIEMFFAIFGLIKSILEMIGIESKR